jgi:uncharacterized protein YfeS
MELLVMARSYNAYGGVEEFSPVEMLFEPVATMFGTGLKEIELTLQFASRPGTKPLPSLESRFSAFHSSLDATSERRFNRKRGILTICTKADFAFAQDVFPKVPMGKSPEYSSNAHYWQRQLLSILASELKACEKKFRGVDGFEFENFLKWVEHLPSILIADQDIARMQLEEFRLRRFWARQALSDWDRLDLNWADFHPSARSIISNPRLWDEADEFSPNGNDTGADTLALAQASVGELTKSQDEGRSFYERIWTQWGFAFPVTANETSEVAEDVHREFVIGLAFAYLKLLGKCPKWLLQLAHEELDRHQGNLDQNKNQLTFYRQASEMNGLVRQVLLK